MNPKASHSQEIGGVVWGIGMALQEATEIDHRYGRIMNPNLQHYHVPVNADIHEIETMFVEEDDTIVNPLGVKGMGELGHGRHSGGHRQRRLPRHGQTHPGSADYAGQAAVSEVDCMERYMNEVRALVEAFDAANVRGEQCALATVVSVEGSSYRRPGARMLVCEDGTSTGTISAGCLENDVIEHAKRVLRTGTAKLVEYNTASTSDEDSLGAGARLQRHRARAGRTARPEFTLHRGAAAFLRGAARRRVRIGRDRVSYVGIVLPGRRRAGARSSSTRRERRHENLSGELAAILEDKLRDVCARGNSAPALYDIDGVCAKFSSKRSCRPSPCSSSEPGMTRCRSSSWRVRWVGRRRSSTRKPARPAAPGLPSPTGSRSRVP